MARPKLRLDLSTAEDKENQSVVKDLKRRSSTDVVGVRELAISSLLCLCFAMFKYLLFARKFASSRRFGVLADLSPSNTSVALVHGSVQSSPVTASSKIARHAACDFQASATFCRLPSFGLPKSRMIPQAGEA